MPIKNIAIIAHVDHGKTTLVDAMLKQTHTFRDNQKEMGESLIMDSNDLEKEKGITILAKNTSVFYKNTKINIIDTPGHADFGGEVERILNMASSAILLVDAAEGPLPQTKFVLRKALEAKLKIVLLINKIDKKDARSSEIVREVENLFLDLTDDNADLDFKVLFSVGRDGKAFYQLPEKYTPDIEGDLTPLFETILEQTEDSAKNLDKPFQMLISTLDWDEFVGRLCIGKVSQGVLNMGKMVSLVSDNKVLGNYKVQKLYTSVGLKKQEVDKVTAGDIIAIAGIPKLDIGQTITDPKNPKSLPKITVEEPTIKITIGPNTSPFSGREGTFISSAQIKQRLLKEKETNLGLYIEDGGNGGNFAVSGRGELHLSILIETMRREGFEMEISKPQVIYKKIDGVTMEPFEEVTIDIDSQFVGVVSEEMSKRGAQLQDMTPIKENTTRFIFKISSQNLLGVRNILMTNTRGTAVLNTYLLGYFPVEKKRKAHRSGALVASQSGPALSYGLANAQDRGILFIKPGTEIYEGMVVGLGNRDHDIEINVCKGKKLTNIRAASADATIQVTPATILSLEQALDFIEDDELLEVTPESLRIRKKYLSNIERKVMQRKEEDKQRELERKN